MDVSENSGTPKSSILIGFSIINHPFWDTTIFGNTHISAQILSRGVLSRNFGAPFSDEFRDGGDTFDHI